MKVERFLRLFFVFTLLFMLVFMCFGSFMPQFEVKTVKALSLDLVSDVRERIDWEMTHYYNQAKDDDTWFFGSYNAVTGVRNPVQTVSLGFLDRLIHAYYATNNSTYLEWLKNAYYDVLTYDIGGKAYCTNFIPITYGSSEGIPLGSWNMSTNLGYIYEGSISTEHGPLILASLLLHKEYGDNIYLSIAKNMTDAILAYRTNQTTGWTSDLYEARYANVYMQGTYYFWSLQSASPLWLTILNCMYDYTGNSTYKEIVDKAWTTLIDKYPDGDWVASTFHINGTEISGSLATLPDTIENYGPSLFYWENATLVDYFEKCWDRYYENWWSTNHFVAHNDAAWLGAEINALVEMYLLSNNQTYLDWAESNYNYWRSQLYSDGFIKYTSGANYARVFGVYWDWGQAVIRLWVATGNQTYYDHFVDLWNHGNENFSKDYGYVSEIYLNGTMKTSTATVTTHNFLDSMMFALITNENEHFSGYGPQILARLNLIDSVDVFDITSTANITSTPTFSNQILTLTVSATSDRTSSTEVYCGDYGKPSTVTGVSSWTYNQATKILTVTVIHSSPETIIIEWVVPSSLTQSIRSNYFLVISLISLVPILISVALILGLVKGREELNLETLAGVAILCAGLIIGTILMIAILNAFIGL